MNDEVRVFYGAGLFLYEDEIKEMAKKQFKIDEDIEDICLWDIRNKYHNLIVCDYSYIVSEELIDIKTNQDVSEICEKTHVFIPADKEMSLFKAAYQDVDEIKNEFEKKFAEFLPENFDIENRIFLLKLVSY